MIARCRGKDYNKVPESRMPKNSTQVIHSIKRDGHYIQAYVDGINNKVEFFTSGGKQFYVVDWAIELLIIFNNAEVMLEMEYVGKTNGELGSLTKCGRITTYRTDYGRGVESKAMAGELSYINAVYPMHKVTKVGDRVVGFDMRNDEMVQYLQHVKDTAPMLAVNYFKFEAFSTAKYSNAIKTASSRIANGWEGSYMLIPSAKFEVGKRVNTRIKLKAGGTVTLVCTGATEGEGKYVGKVGSLLLDTDGTVASDTVSVGSGLSDEQRDVGMCHYVGREVKIKYFAIKSNYIQPVIVKIL